MSIAFICVSLGYPNCSTILVIYPIVVLDSNKGLPNNISPSMQPRVHISVALVYLFEPSKISGAV